MNGLFWMLFATIHLVSAQPMDENAQARRVIDKAKRLQEQFDHCEIVYFTEIVSSNVDEAEAERFSGGFSGYESWQTNDRFLFASQDALRRSGVTQELREQSIPDLKAYHLITLSNEGYQARVEKTSPGPYILRALFSPGEFGVLPQHSVRYLFAPRFDDWSDATAIRFIAEDDISGLACCSMEWERCIPEDNPPSWERRRVYLDVDDGRCLGQKIVYSDTSGFEDPSATEEYVIEYDSRRMPTRVVRTRTGRYEFTQVYELVQVAIGRQATERFFLPHYGINLSGPPSVRFQLSYWMIGTGLLSLILGLASRRIARRKSASE